MPPDETGHQLPAGSGQPLRGDAGRLLLCFGGASCRAIPIARAAALGARGCPTPAPAGMPRRTAVSIFGRTSSGIAAASRKPVSYRPWGGLGVEYWSASRALSGWGISGGSGRWWGAFIWLPIAIDPIWSILFNIVSTKKNFKRFDYPYKSEPSDYLYMFAVMKDMMQIGKLTDKLTDDLRRPIPMYHGAK